MTWSAKENDPEQVFSGSIPSARTLMPSFHCRRQRLKYRVLAVLAAYMSQHGAGGLRLTAAESVIELVDAQDVRGPVASEGHRARASGNPVDRVHHASAYALPVLPGVIVVILGLCWFESKGVKDGCWES
jgi:hypothetical protein